MITACNRSIIGAELRLTFQGRPSTPLPPLSLIRSGHAAGPKARQLMFNERHEQNKARSVALLSWGASPTRTCMARFLKPVSSPNCPVQSSMPAAVVAPWKREAAELHREALLLEKPFLCQSGQQTTGKDLIHYRDITLCLRCSKSTDRHLSQSEALPILRV